MADEKPTSPVKKTVLQLAVGVALGFLVACLAGPRVISFWYQPPSKDAFSCAGSVENALAQFVWLQLGCAALGAFGLWLALFFGGRLLRGKGPDKAPAP
jgi:hypothetical protein